jgi:hypothetical protein
VANKLRDFLIELSTNEQTKENYRNNPDATMTNAGLSAQEQQWIKDGNLDEINNNIGEDHTAGKWIDISES